MKSEPTEPFEQGSDHRSSAASNFVDSLVKIRFVCVPQFEFKPLPVRSWASGDNALPPLSCCLCGLRSRECVPVIRLDSLSPNHCCCIRPARRGIRESKHRPYRRPSALTCLEPVIQQVAKLPGPIGKAKDHVI